MFSLAGSALLLIGASIWTAAINKSKVVNDIVLTLSKTNTAVSLGFTVSAGSGLYLLWASFVCLLLSVIPYMIRCVSYMMQQSGSLTFASQLLHVPRMNEAPKMNIAMKYLRLMMD